MVCLARYTGPCINSLILGGFGYSLKLVNFKLISMINILSIFSEIAIRWMPLMSLIISQHWFRQWLGAVRQQAITLANVDPDPCRHMTSLGHNQLIIKHSELGLQKGADDLGPFVIRWARAWPMREAITYVTSPLIGCDLSQQVKCSQNSDLYRNPWSEP